MKSLLDPDEPAPERVAELRSDRWLQQVFTLLGFRLDPDATALALRALSSDDKKLCGTAIEYLDNVIPTEIESALLPRLTEERPWGHDLRKVSLRQSMSPLALHPPNEVDHHGL